MLMHLGMSEEFSYKLDITFSGTPVLKISEFNQIAHMLFLLVASIYFSYTKNRQ